jgi:acetyl/propionyl-CoA carboxylase alpha subunit
MPTRRAVTSSHAVLIANRGEIALRIRRAVRSLGPRMVGMYAPDEPTALHVRMVDEAQPVDSYLDAEQLVAIAHRTGRNLVHPGYGVFQRERRLRTSRGAARTGISMIFGGGRRQVFGRHAAGII